MRVIAHTVLKLCVHRLIKHSVRIRIAFWSSRDCVYSTRCGFRSIISNALDERENNQTLLIMIVCYRTNLNECVLYVYSMFIATKSKCMLHKNGSSFKWHGVRTYLKPRKVVISFLYLKKVWVKYCTYIFAFLLFKLACDRNEHENSNNNNEKETELRRKKK